MLIYFVENMHLNTIISLSPKMYTFIDFIIILGVFVVQSHAVLSIIGSAEIKSKGTDWL